MHGVTVSAHFYYQSEFFFTREVILYGHALRGHAPRTRAGLESQALAPPPRAHPQVPSPPARCSATTGCCLALTLETNDGPLLPLHSVSLISRLPGAFRPGWELHRTLRFLRPGFETETRPSPRGRRASGLWSLSSTEALPFSTRCA